MVRLKILAILLLCTFLIQIVALPFIIKPAFGLPPLSITVQTNKTSYYVGEIVEISGEVKDKDGSPVSGVTIGIEVKDSSGNRIILDGTWSQIDGRYQDQFKLPAATPLGEYKLYITAKKAGYESASNQASFFVTTPQFGHTIVKIIGHTIEMLENNMVTAKYNVTMFSKTLTATTITNRLILLSPTGAIKYDNFRGIGSSQDLRKITIANGTMVTVTFQFILSSPTPGYYTHMFCIFDEYGSNRLDATPWAPAFLYTPPPKYTQNLGSLEPNSQITTSININLARYESARLSLTLTQPLRSLTIDIGAASPSKLLVSLNQSSNTVKHELINNYQWTICNLPSGPYTLNIIALSSSAHISSLSIQSTNQITATSVTITHVEATTKIATPGGKVSYHVFVQWDITADDTLNVSASIQGTITDTQEIEIATLSFREKDFYLSITIPSEGTFEVLFTARLKQAGVSAQHTTHITSQKSEYNITVLSSVTYYKQPSFWEWIWGARTPKYFKDPSQLSILDVKDIKVVDVGVDQQNNPKNATIEFMASSKAGSWLSFGDGPHYDVWLQDSQGYSFQVGVIFAGESNKKCYAILPIDTGRRLSFTIYFKISLWAETICLTFSAVEVLINVYTSGLSSAAAQFTSDIAKLTALYIYQLIIENERGYMTKSDIATVLLGSGVPQDIVDLAEKLLLKNNFNPALAIISALVDGFSDKKIDVWTFATAIVRFIIYIVNRSKPDLANKILSAFNKACQRYLIEVPSNLQKIGLTEIEKFLRNIGIIFSILRLVKIVYDLWTCPPEEGKIVNSKAGTETPINPFDPLIKITYEGPTLNTPINYFGDIQSVHFSAVENLPQTTALASFTVDPNMTANYLEILSQQTFQKTPLRSIGFNATSTSLKWQNEANTFLIEGSGLMFEGLHKMNFTLNSTKIQGALEMSADAVPLEGKAFLNVSLLYPFGKNLSYTIQVVLPPGSSNIRVLSPGNYTIENNVITWNEPVDYITVEFIPLPGDVNGDGIVNILDLTRVGIAFGSYPGHPKWDPWADLNRDNKVNVLDLSLVGINFGKKASAKYNTAAIQPQFKALKIQQKQMP